MVTFLAITFPLILALLLIKLMPYTLDDFFSKEEQNNLKELTTSLSENQKKHQSILLLGGLIIFGVPLTLFQYFLINSSSQSYASALFAYFAWDDLIYSVMHAFFMSMFFSGVVSFRYTYAKQGREAIREELLISVGGIANYFNLKYHKYLVLGFGIVFSIANLFAVNTFIRVEPEKLYYSDFFSLQTQSAEYDSIDCVIRYSRRIVPNGNNIIKPYVELQFGNNKFLDTFYLVERKHHKNLVSSIESAAKRKIPYIKIKTTKDSYSGNACDNEFSRKIISSAR